jgi:hypothetical protein
MDTWSSPFSADAMKHFDITEWSDFARGVADEADRAAMNAHVASGCVPCRDTLALVNRVVESARADVRSEPPEQVVRCAKAISALLTPRRSGLSRLVARLVHDSLSDPVPAGLRGEDRVSPHGLYEAGPFCIAVRLEQERGAPIATLVGQLTNREAPDLAMAEAPVLLMTGTDVIAHTIYNRFGEFQMDYPPSRNLRLCVALDHPAKRLEVLLKPLTPKTAARGMAPSSHERRARTVRAPK